MANRRKKVLTSDSPTGSVAPSESEIPRDDRPSDEEIRVRAYELYLERGGENGNAVDDWVRAENEFRERSNDRSRRVR